MKKLYNIIILIFFLVTISACAQPKILERISLTTLIGYDFEEENKVTTTAIIRQVNPEFQNKVEVQSDTELTSKGARLKIDLKTSKQIAAGQLRVVLFGDELAKEGINEYLHILMMTSEISNNIYLAVVEGEAKTLLEHDYENIEDIGQHIFNLIDHNVKQQYVISSTLHEIARDHYSPFQDVALPIVKKEGEFIKISGVALFEDGKIAGQLSSDDIPYIIMVQDGFQFGSLEFNLPSADLTSNDSLDNLQVAIDSIRSRKQIKLTDKSTPEFDLRVDLKCRLLEIHSSVSLGDPKIVKEIESEINKKIESEIQRIISQSQEMNSDVFGFGEHYYSSVRYSNLDEKKWNEMYPNMKVNIQIETQILRDGVFE